MGMVKSKYNFTTEMAVLLSLLLHMAAFVSWQYRDTLLHIPFLHLLSYLIPAEKTVEPQPPTPKTPTITFVEAPAPALPSPTPRKPSQPRRFVEVDESQPSSETPKDAKLYSTKSTLAANPNNPTGRESDTPYLDGTDKRMLSTETVVPSKGSPPAPPPKPVTPKSVMPPIPPSPPAVQPTPPAPPAQPAPPAKPVVTKVEEPPKKIAEEGIKLVQEKPAAPENQVALLKNPTPPVLPVLPTPPAQPARPVEPASPPMPPAAPGAPASHREIGALKSQMIASGSARIGVTAMNVASSPLGEYHKGLTLAIQSRWFALVDKNGLYERAGTVTVQFFLLSDGSLKTDANGRPVISTKDEGAGVVLSSFCEKAILDSAPFAPFTEELKTLRGSDPLEIVFTFYY